MVTIFKSFEVEGSASKTLTVEGAGFDWDSTLLTTPDPFFEHSRRVATSSGLEASKEALESR